LPSASPRDSRAALVLAAPRVMLPPPLGSLLSWVSHGRPLCVARSELRVSVRERVLDVQLRGAAAPRSSLRPNECSCSGPAVSPSLAFMLSSLSTMAADARLLTRDKRQLKDTSLRKSFTAAAGTAQCCRMPPWCPPPRGTWWPTQAEHRPPRLRHRVSWLS
jgi:hypothetical protein